METNIDEGHQSEFQLCNHPNHNSIRDCNRAIVHHKQRVLQNLDKFNCEIRNLMFYTQEIRKKRNIQHNYTKVIRVFEQIQNHNIEFPLDCRMIASMLTNIYMCSSDSTEAAWAQGVNMFVQFEKLHMHTKNVQNAKKNSCNFTNDGKTDADWNQKLVKTFDNDFEKFSNMSSTFERFNCKSDEDLFRNVFIRDVAKMKAFPLVFFLYKRALRLLLTEDRSIIFSLYNNNRNPGDSKTLDNFLKQWNDAKWRFSWDLIWNDLKIQTIFGKLLFPMNRCVVTVVWRRISTPRNEVPYLGGFPWMMMCVIALRLLFEVCHCDRISCSGSTCGQRVWDAPKRHQSHASVGVFLFG